MDILDLVGSCRSFKDGVRTLLADAESEMTPDMYHHVILKGMRYAP